MDFKNILDSNNDILNYYGNSITLNKINIKAGYLYITSNLSQTINEGQSAFAIIWNDPSPVTNNNIIISPDSTQFTPSISGVYSVNCNFLLSVVEPDFLINNIEIFFRINKYNSNDELEGTSIDAITFFNGGNTVSANGARYSSSLSRLFTMYEGDYIQVIAGIGSATSGQNFTIQILQASLIMNYINGDLP